MVVTLDEILAARRPHVLRKWLEHLYAAYPPESGAFLAREQDPCANPVGQTLRDAAEAVYECLCHPSRAGECPALEHLMRLRAVEGSRPSQAVAFLLALKRLVRAEAVPALRGEAAHAELESLDDRIDALTLQAVDLFATYRDKLAALQVQEARRSTQKLIERLQQERDREET